MFDQRVALTDVDSPQASLPRTRRALRVRPRVALACGARSIPGQLADIHLIVQDAANSFRARRQR